MISYKTLEKNGFKDTPAGYMLDNLAGIPSSQAIESQQKRLVYRPKKDTKKGEFILVFWQKKPIEVHLNTRSLKEAMQFYNSIILVKGY